MKKLAKKEIRSLIQEATCAKAYSYSPYSHFRVGAALLTQEGKIYSGCNVESAAYSPTNCAERTAIFKAVSEGEKDFAAIAVTTDSQDFYLSPCGVCRQVMAEFCDEDFLVIMAKSEEDYQIENLSALFPRGFGKGNLE